jgi:hypothetical protein
MSIYTESNHFNLLPVLSCNVINIFLGLLDLYERIYLNPPKIMLFKKIWYSWSLQPPFHTDEFPCDLNNSFVLEGMVLVLNFISLWLQDTFLYIFCVMYMRFVMNSISWDSLVCLLFF